MELEAGVVSYLPVVSENSPVQAESAMVARRYPAFAERDKPRQGAGEAQPSGKGLQVSIEVGISGSQRPP